MDKTKKKKVQMPSGIRSKLTAAIAMLLISSLLVVGSTYAWFTLSTAPEVTGITTSVGANGNLEIALLNNTTFNALDTIQSGVGNSYEATSNYTVSNITWGNLVNLRDGYSLDKINLLPARLFIDNGKTSITGPLKTAVYGADGRVNTITGTTYMSGFYNNGWVYDSTTPTYGVRAIGANDNLTPQQAGYLEATFAYNNSLNDAKAAIQSALANNGANLASAITNIAMGNTGSGLSSEQQTAISAMVTASNTALGEIDAAYKQVLVAAASALEDSTAYTTATGAFTGAANFAEALTLASSNGVTVPQALTDASTNLTAQKAAVTAAQGAIDSSDYTTALSKLVETNMVTVNGFKVGTPNVAEGETYDDYLVMADRNLNSNFISKAMADSGIIVEMPGKFVVNGEGHTVFEGSGVFAYIGSVAGNYSANCKVSINYGGMNVSNMPATMKTTANVDTTVKTALNNVQVSGTSTGTSSVLSDTYGYALDFAFRTNASGSKLQLQTAASQRVYSDGTNAATQGSGSNMTFKSAVDTDNGGQPYLSDAQVASLMEAIRVAFINPDDGTIYAVAALDNITTSGDAMKGDLVLKNYSVDNGTGVMTLTAKTDATTKDDIMELPQNTATKLTAVVWLDGDKVDNGDVANALQSITGSMNLQFSSSADLTPMQNTALKNGRTN